MKTPRLFKESLAILIILILMIIVPLSIISQQSNTQPQIYPSLSNKTLITETPEDDKTLSPYFFVKSEGTDTEQLPMKSTSADVSISGVIADVQVNQVYVNTGKTAIEAVYVFPASTRAAVYKMQMTVGGRIITARIREREKARQEYTEAVSQGKSASLLEQQRPNVFQMNVGNIMPGDTITVQLCYTELLIPESGVYEFVYPTVVGPRYSNTPDAIASSNNNWVSNPYLHEGEKPTYTFDIGINISTGIHIKEISCPSHQMNIAYDGPADAQLSLKNTQAFEGNRDLIIQYRLAGNAVESGLLLYKDEKSGENFFLAMVQPPAKPKPEQIPAREYIFIVDVSGSMHGYPIETSKKLMKNLIGNIRTTDKFNVVLFAGGSKMFSEQSVYATEENLKKAIYTIDNEYGGGGTELLPALKKAMAVEKQPGFSRTFVIATDGYVSVEKEAFEYIRNNLSKANFFAFGIGSSVNRFLIEGIAHAGMGEAFIVTDEATANEKADKFRDYIQNPVFTDIKVNFGTFNAYDAEPLNVPDVLAQRPVIIFGKWKGEAQGIISISGISGKTDMNFKLDASKAVCSDKNAAIKYLWARQRIRMLDDFNKAAADTKLQEEITGLGLRYNLLTAYTSFVAIDSVIRNKGGNQQTIIQPLPLPQGVSDYAVGQGSYGGAVGCVTTNMSIQSVACEKVKESKDENYTVTEQAPTYVGGESAMKKFLESNIIYPQKAKDAGITGTVYIEFTVEASGDLSNIQVIRGIGYGCDEEAVRLVKLMKNKWLPAKTNGKKIAVKMMLPVKFKL